MKAWLPYFVLLLLAVVPYWPALWGGFIWDDITFISDNNLIHHPSGIKLIWFSHDSADYWPLTYSVFWVLWRMFADATLGYHLVNVMVHALNGILIWKLFERMGFKWGFAAAAIFAVHPVNVEAVAWIFQLKTTMSAVLVLGCTWLWLGYLNSASMKYWIGAVVVFFLSLLTKASGVTWPLVLGGIWFYQRRRLDRDGWKLLPFFALSLVMGLLNLFWYRYSELAGGEVVRSEGVLEKLLAAGYAFWFYWWKALWPVNLAFIYPRWENLGEIWWDYLPLMAFVAVTAVLIWRRHWTLFAGWFYFFVVLFPVLGAADIYFMRYSLVADHWQYLSLLAPIGLFCLSMERVLLSPRNRFLVQIGIVLTMAGCTWQQASIYQSEKTIWQDTVQKNPEAWMAHNNLGVLLLAEGDGGSALHHFQRAIQIKSDYADAYNNMGAYYIGINDVANAQQALEKSLVAFPNYARALNNLAVLALKMGRLEKAIEYELLAVHHLPNYFKGYANLGVLFTQAGQQARAITAYESALRLRPTDPDIQNRLKTLRNSNPK